MCIRDRYDSEQAELESKMETMKSEIAEDKSSSVDIRHFISLIRKCKNPTEILSLIHIWCTPGVRWGKTWRLLQKVTYHNKADYSADCFAAAEVLHMGALHLSLIHI